MHQSPSDLQADPSLAGDKVILTVARARLQASTFGRSLVEHLGDLVEDVAAGISLNVGWNVAREIRPWRMWTSWENWENCDLTQGEDNRDGVPENLGNTLL